MTGKYLHLGSEEYDGPEPFLYRLHASAFLECAELAVFAIHKKYNSKPNMMQNVPIVYLICHSIEMFLKLALYKTGLKDKELKLFDMRHNLTNLKTKCENNGVVFSEDVSSMIDSLSPLHTGHKLRYSAFVEDPVWLPFNPSEMIELTRKLIGASHPSQSA